MTLATNNEVYVHVLRQRQKLKKKGQQKPLHQLNRYLKLKKNILYFSFLKVDICIYYMIIYLFILIKNTSM